VIWRLARSGDRAFNASGRQADALAAAFRGATDDRGGHAGAIARGRSRAAGAARGDGRGTATLARARPVPARPQPGAALPRRRPQRAHNADRVPGARQFEHEDLLDPAIYSDAFVERFNVDVRSSPWTEKLGKGKWSSRMALIFKAAGQAWDDEIETQAKTAVADSVVADSGAALKPEAQPVIESLSRALVEKLGTPS
jgi:hypothetical protein